LLLFIAQANTQTRQYALFLPVMNVTLSILLFGLPGGMEAVLIFAVILLIFGGKKIPELMRGLGKGIGEFNSARDTIKEELEAGMKETDQEATKE